MREVLLLVFKGLLILMVITLFVRSMVYVRRINKEARMGEAPYYEDVVPCVYEPTNNDLERNVVYNYRSLGTECEK